MTFNVRSRRRETGDREGNAKLLIELRLSRRCFDISIWCTIGEHTMPFLPYVLVAFVSLYNLCVWQWRPSAGNLIRDTRAIHKVECAYLSMRMQISAVACVSLFLRREIENYNTKMWKGKRRMPSECQVRHVMQFDFWCRKQSVDAAKKLNKKSHDICSFSSSNRCSHSVFLVPSHFRESKPT